MIVYSQLPLKVLLSSVHLALSDLIPPFSLDFMLNSPKNSSKSFQQHQTWWLLIFLREEIRRQRNTLKKTSKSLKMSLIIESQNCIEIFRWQGSPEGLQSNLLLTAGLLLSSQQFPAPTYGCCLLFLSCTPLRRMWLLLLGNILQIMGD